MVKLSIDDAFSIVILQKAQYNKAQCAKGMDVILPTLETALQGFSSTTEALSAINRVRLTLCKDSSRRKVTVTDPHLNALNTGFRGNLTPLHSSHPPRHSQFL